MSRSVALLALLACLALPLLTSAEDKLPDPPSKQAPKFDKPRLDLYGEPLPPGALARLGTIRFRSEGENFLLRFAPDGKTLTSVGTDALHVWDVGTGKEIRRGMKHPAE